MTNGEQFCVVLVRTQGPINLGLVSRICGNTGITDLRLVSPQCDRASEEARKFANHKAEFLQQTAVFSDMASALHDVGLAIGTSARVRDEEYGNQCSITDIPAVIQQRGAQKVALVFGNEADGLTNEELQHCQYRLHLDTPGDYSSYNLSHAVAIICHHLCCLTDLPPFEAEPAATREMVDRLGTYWLDSLDRFNYFRRTSRERFTPLFRLLLNRLHFCERDVTTLFGILAQFNYYTFGDKGSRGLEADDHVEHVSDNPDGPPA